MLSRVSLGRGNSPPARTSSTYHSGSSRHTVYPHSLYLQHAGFSTIFTYFAVFRQILHHFPHFWPPGPTCRAEPAAGTQKQGGRAPARGGNAAPRRPVAAAAPRGPPGPERRRRERRGEPRRTGGREPGAERPPGGPPGRSGQRASASTGEGTAAPAAEGPTTPNPRSGRGGGAGGGA